ncbi:MAG: membrane integrity-associated transporter subunit PqiC [Gammaproteobacteria bacterium]|nr:membrane integrity-associated transporter subunit PqiC [Gammaproteobacteria bacterium]
MNARRCRRGQGAVRLLVMAVTLALGACGGLLQSDAPVLQRWVLAVPPAAAGEPAAAIAPLTPPGAALATLRVLRPLAAPALDTDRIALRRADRTLDYYAANRWSGPAPEVLQGLVLDALRSAGAYGAVQPESAPFAYDETLQVELRDFQAEYAASAVPTIRVTLVCTLGRRSDNRVLTTFALSGSAAAGDNRMSAIVAAFDAALAASLAGLPERIAAARR